MVLSIGKPIFSPKPKLKNHITQQVPIVLFLGWSPQPALLEAVRVGGVLLGQEGGRMGLCGDHRIV